MDKIIQALLDFNDRIFHQGNRIYSLELRVKALEETLKENGIRLEDS